MLKRFIPVILFSLFDASLARADTVQLKDKAAITGKILARKHDQVIMDIGYTVLAIPRNQIEKIMEGDSRLPPQPRRKTNRAFSNPPAHRCRNVPFASWSASWGPPSSRCALRADWGRALSSTKRVI